MAQYYSHTSNRRFNYGNVEIYIPFSSRVPFIHVNGKAVLRALPEEHAEIAQPETQAAIVARLKKYGFLK